MTWNHCVKNQWGCYETPMEGQLSLNFNIEHAIENSIKGIADDDYGSFIEQHMEIVKISPAFNKIIPLFGSWKLLDGKNGDQMVWLNALAKDFMLMPAHLEHLCKSCTSMRKETIYRLLPSVKGGETAEALCMLLFGSVGEFLQM